MSNQVGVSKSYFQAAKTWSSIKLRLLGQYLKPFSWKLGSKHRQIFYIDGFAGRGRYENGTEGSPLVAARQAKQAMEEGRPFQLHCINVEADEETFANLEQHTADYVKDRLTYLLPQSLRERIVAHKVFHFASRWCTLFLHRRVPPWFWPYHRPLIGYQEDTPF